MNIYCANNNTVYQSVPEAAKDLGIDRTAVHRQLTGERKSVGGYIFAKIDDISPAAVRAARAWLLYSAYKIVLDCEDAPIMHERR